MNEQINVQEVRVKASTEVSKLAGSLLHRYEANPDAPICVVAMGATAVNQAVKGIIAFNEYLVKRGYAAYPFPSFHNFTVDGQPMTAIQFQLKITRM